MHYECRPIPRATYRLQLSKAFTFRDVMSIAGYLGQLGISHAYLSPILQARSGSTHGYDTVDHRSINSELGTLDEFREMARTLREEGIAIILDIVPNHMGIGGDQNDLWLDVLKWGPRSPYADWFDINWDPIEPTLKNKVLVPFLGRSYGEALRDGALTLQFDENVGALTVWAEDTHKLPICPSTYGEILGKASPELSSFALRFKAIEDRDPCLPLQDELAAHCRDHPDAASAILDVVKRVNNEPGRSMLGALIAQQHWRPASASTASDDINYRRFFIVADLAALRVERDDVFDHVHDLPFQLIAEGLVDGLRIDHIDGLYDPKAYCLKLRMASPRPIYLVVEKILAPGELLRTDWEVEGTTGYEFSGAVTRLLTDPASEDVLTNTYQSYTGQTATLQAVERAAKLEIVDFEMAAELDGLVARLRSLAVSHPLTADLTRNSLRSALRATVAEMQVYRTYVAEDDLTLTDRGAVGRAISRARDATPALDPSVFSFVEKVMTSSNGIALETAMRIQQYTGPVMAKGLEDTALYRFNRLLALSDVGEKPDQFTQSVPAFHEFIRGRLTEQKNGLLSTSSHDSKRGEDARARIVAISGHADEWAAGIFEWTTQLAQQGAPEIERSDAYHFFQLLLGAWPADQIEASPSSTGFDSFRGRLQQAMLKSVREARVRTNWNVPNDEYEARIKTYVSAALSSDQDNHFLHSFRRFEAKVASHGAQNSLVETVLKFTMPGVPDIYQGAEHWEQSMVDPDNRRPVDFDARRIAIPRAATADLSDLARRFRTGDIKLALIVRLLAYRKRHPDLFVDGSYEPVSTTGPAADRVLAFIRRAGRNRLLVAVALGPWRGAAAASLLGEHSGTWRDILRRRDVELDNELGTILGDNLPFAVLARKE
jgi:(1->4)-alpha-D-glucan 1-alpha-D-glucosylmutase